MDGKRLRQLRESARLTLADLSERIGVTSVTLSRWETGINEPSDEKKRKLSEFFGVTIGYLVGENQEESVSNPRIGIKPLMIPVISNDIKACCGSGSIYAEDVEWDIVDYYPGNPSDFIGYTWQAGESGFAIITAEGDSMEPLIYEGDKVVFVKCPEVSPISGDIVLALFGGRLLIRGIEFRVNEIILHPANNNYQDIKTHNRDTRLCVIGKVLGKPEFKKLSMW